MAFEKPRPPASYLIFTRNEWAALRASMPLPVTDADLNELRGLNDPVSLADVADIYLPLSRLLNLQITAAHALSTVVEGAFLGRPQPFSTYIIGIAGSVAVGKSTFARLLQAVLAHWPDRPRVDLVTTDGFLYPTSVLEQRELLRRKGFPESYDQRRMLGFLTAVKAGETNIRIPIYSHEIYDIVPDKFQTINRPHILIFEGLNVSRQPPRLPPWRLISSIFQSISMRIHRLSKPGIWNAFFFFTALSPNGQRQSCIDTGT